MLVLALTIQDGTPLLDDQTTAGALVCAIPKAIIGDWTLKPFTELRRAS